MISLIIFKLIFLPVTADQAARYNINQDYIIDQRMLAKFDLSYMFDNGIKFKGLISADAKPSLILVIAELRETGLLAEITEFKGCYNPRAVRGSSKPSTHAYGLACDFNNDKFTEEFVNVWEKYGWCWGGRWKTVKDWMHFSYTDWEC